MGAAIAAGEQPAGGTALSIAGPALHRICPGRARPLPLDVRTPGRASIPCPARSGASLLQLRAADSRRGRTRSGRRSTLGTRRRQRRLVVGARLRDAATERPSGHGGQRRRFVASDGAEVFSVAGGSLAAAGTPAMI